MNTPPSSKHLRPRRLPTPKMSSRKKELFASSTKPSPMLLSIDEDSDLGPITLLEFSSPESYDEPLEHRRVKHLSDRRSDFSNLMEQLSPAIRKSCRISQPDESPKKIIYSPVKTITRDMPTEDSMLDKENCSEETLKTPVVGGHTTTAPRISFRKTQNADACNDGTFSPSSRKGSQRRKSENKLKTDASTTESPKAKASLTFSEISAKSFYGSANSEPVVKRQSIERTPIDSKSTKKRAASVPNRRHHERRPIPRRPVLGSLRKISHKRKPKKSEATVKLIKQQLLLGNIEKIIENYGLKKYFDELQPNAFDQQLLGGPTGKPQKESEKSSHDSMTSAPIDDFQRSEFSDDESEDDDESSTLVRKRKFFKTKSSGSQNRYQVTKGISATVERGHGIKLLSPARKKSKMDDGYDELLSIQREVFDIVKRLSASKNAEKNDDRSQPNSANASLPVAREQLDTEMHEDLSEFDKYRNSIPYNTTDSLEIDRQRTVLEILIQNGICDDEHFRIFISEYEQHKEKANQILNNLFEVSVLPDVNKDADASVGVLENDSMIQDPVASGSASVDESQKGKLEFHPIFYKEHRRSDLEKDILALPLPKKMLKWIPLANNQLQIDAGQKEFGSKTCSQCGMFYTLHDPEDEMLHQKFHNNMMGILSFKGWTDENLVANIEEWGTKGRIIWVNRTGIKTHVDRVMEVLEIVNKDLGFSDVELQHNSIVYLAISRKHIIGVCVAEPLKQAHPMYTQNEVEFIDLKTVVPVKCGISRIWVSPQFRRYGVATRLIQTVCSHFVRGCHLSANEIAFSTPTVMGKKFAQSIATNVLIYDQVDEM